MKKTKVLGIIVLAAGFAGFTYKNDLHTKGLHFVAPTIKGLISVDEPQKGEIVFESNDGFFYGYTGTRWAKLSAEESVVPYGSIIPFGGKNDQVPSGYLPADGRALLIADYPDLYQAIKTNYGSGIKNNDNTATGYAQGTAFNIPDLRGRFARGVDGGAGRDPSAAGRDYPVLGDTLSSNGDNVGSVQGDLLRAHRHIAGMTTFNSANDAVAMPYGYVTGPSVGRYFTTAAGTGSLYAYTAYDGGAETRPTNINVNFMIKAK